MLKARFLGALATMALLASTAACDSPTAVTRRDGEEVHRTLAAETGLSQAQIDAAQADSFVAEFTVAQDTFVNYAVQTTSGTETYYIPLGTTHFKLIVPINSTVTKYTDPSNANLQHIVVKTPDGRIIHYIWDATTGKMKKYEKPAPKPKTTASGTIT